MKALILFAALFFFVPADADAQFLNEFRWKSRLVLVFTPSPSDPLFVRQMQLLQEAKKDFEDRNVVFMMITPDGTHENTGLFLDEAASRQYYEYFGVAQYQMEMILVGLDGTEKLRAKNKVTAPSVLLQAIDGMPMRQRQLLQGETNKSQIESQDGRVVTKRRRF